MGQQWNEEGDSKMTLEAEPRLGTPLEIQRILVALDASPGSLAALATAAIPPMITAPAITSPTEIPSLSRCPA